jgi:hypothetical protein
MMIQTATIDWQPFGGKHKRYIKSATRKRICVAEGAIRSGKTIDHCIIASMHLEHCPDQIHLASGSTLANAKMNIGYCNGCGLEFLFRGRCRWGKFKNNEALYIQTKTGEKIVIFAGGGKADSYKNILGNSYGLWIATEINEHYDSEGSRTSFIKVAMGRQAAAVQPLTLWDLNPCHPEHTIYSRYIDAYGETLGSAYQHERFVMADNLSIPKARQEEIAAQYTPGSVWYRRDILGERVAAEGLVYQQFADDPQRYTVHVDDDWIRDADFVSIGIDFGGTRSLTTFVASALHRNFSKVTALADHHIKGKKGDIDADKVCREFVGFVQRLRTKYPRLYIKYVWGDSEAQYLINSLRKTIRMNGLAIEIGDSAKYPIIERIIAANTLLNTGRMFVADDCELVQRGMRSAVWDKKKPDTRLDNFSTDIDILDGYEYSWERFIPRLCTLIKERRTCEYQGSCGYPE